VRTVDDVIGGVVQAGSALQNPSLENGSPVPTCWQQGATGTNTAKYTLVADPFDGKLAQRIDITSFSSGARRLVTTQDKGACAPVVIPGHAYLIEAHYHATTAPRFTVYYRTTAGVWKFFTQSAAFPTHSSYVAARYTTPALPADAAAISFGLSIYGVGSLTMDDFALADATLSDTTPPTASISAPAAGATVTGTTAIVAAVADNVGIVRVRFYLDGTQLGSRTVAPFRWNWDTSTSTRGTHHLAVQAEDSAGNATRSPAIAVTVQ
jgi:Big-like domain-containing protein